jgi:hypothetical protein
LDAVIAGDVAYNGIHQWLAQTDHEKRLQWIVSVEQIEALKPKIVVAGHKRPDARDDEPDTILGDATGHLVMSDLATQARSPQAAAGVLLGLRDVGLPQRAASIDLQDIKVS